MTIAFEIKLNLDLPMNYRDILEQVKEYVEAIEAVEARINAEKAPERQQLLSVLQVYIDKPRPTAWEHILKDER